MSVMITNCNWSKTLCFPVVNDFTKTNTCQNTKLRWSSRSRAVTMTISQEIERRSANYQPTKWDPKHIESFNTPFNDDHFYRPKLEEMKDRVKSLLVSTTDPCSQLNLIDAMQRLGVAYHFEDEILVSLTLMTRFEAEDLYTTALHFRIMRENSIMVDSGVFERFRDKSGNFMENLKDDLDGLLSLYEASYLGTEGEDVLEDARIFSTQHLRSLLATLESKNDHQANEVRQALEVPSRWRMKRIEARNFIDIYENKRQKCMELLEFAKLDYNMVQPIYQRELKELSKWWRELNFKEKLPFTRDRLMELYLWVMSTVLEPQFSKCRIGITKFFCILTSMDDIYDIYGSIDELEIFTQAVNRWEVKEAMENLPEYMRILYLANFNFWNDLAYDVLQKHNINALPHIRKAIEKQCESYLVEAQWFHSGYTPTFAEYIGNSWISVGAPIGLVIGYLIQDCYTSEDSVELIEQAHELIYWSSLIARLADDLGTSKDESKRGDVTKSIECYMIERDVNEEEAKAHVKNLMRHSWKKLNEESFKKISNQEQQRLRNLCLNMARAGQFMYHYGDGVGASTEIYKHLINSLILEPIPMN